MNSIALCGICGEPRHNGRCVDVLRAALREVRGQLSTKQVPIVGETSPKLDVRMVSNGEDKVAARKAYKREWTRRQREEAKRAKQ